MIEYKVVSSSAEECLDSAVVDSDCGENIQSDRQHTRRVWNLHRVVLVYFGQLYRKESDNY